MSNSLPFLLIILSLLFNACQSDTADSEESITTGATIATNVITDSIAQLYQQYLQQRENVYPTSCNPELGKVNPADAAPTDTLFFVFREQLREVVANKDIFGLLPHVDEQIKTGFGAENGLQTFIQMWELDSPDKVPQSQLWPTLKAVLELGGQFADSGIRRTFEAPYLGPCWPDDTDPFEYGAVVGAGVRLRAGASLNTQILNTLSYDLVKYLETTPTETTIGGETHPWVKVQLADGTEGLLYGKFYRSPLDFRAVFRQNAGGQWKMVSLLAGD